MKGLKRLLVFLKKYTRECFLAPGFKMLEAIFELIVPLIIARLIDEGLGGGSRLILFQSAGMLLLLALIGMTVAISAQYFAAKAAIGFSTDLRNYLFGHMCDLSREDWDKTGTSTMITRITSDVNQAQTGVNMFLRLFLRSPFVVFGAMIMAFTIDVNAAMIFVIVIAVLFAVVVTIMKINIPALKEAQKGLDAITRGVRENIKGSRVLRAFCKEKQEMDSFNHRLDTYTAGALKAGDISSLMNPITYIIINVGICVLISVGNVRVEAGELSQGQVVALFNYMSQILVELIKLANLVVTLNKGLAAADRISEIIDMEPSMYFPDEASHNDKPAFENEALLECRDVTYRYISAAEPSLKNISFTLKKGEFMGITGSTGSGKSTLVNLIQRAYDTTDGAILLEGRNIKELTVKELHENIGVVMQKAVMFRGTVRENLLMGLENKDISDEELSEALKIAEAGFVFEKNGLDYEIEQGGKNLSGGQRQRLSVARALVRKPGLLIMDDSFSALDYITDRNLRKNIASMKERPTMIVVSQRSSTIRNADKILVLEDGEAVGLGTHEELLDICSVYSEIYSSQSDNEEEVEA